MASVAFPCTAVERERGEGERREREAREREARERETRERGGRERGERERRDRVNRLRSLGPLAIIKLLGPARTQPRWGCMYRGTSLIRDAPLLGPYTRTLPRFIWWS